MKARGRLHITVNLTADYPKKKNKNTIHLGIKIKNSSPQSSR
jgi:hypothetical protein